MRIIPLLAILAIAAGCRKEEPKSVTIASDSAAKGTGEPDASGYRVMDVANPGRITGRVKLTGKAPALRDFDIPSDAAACATASKNNRFQSGADAGLAGAVIYLDHVAQGKAFSAGEIAIDQRGCQYTPHVVAAPLGSRVTFTNSDDVMHNVRVENPANDSVLMNRAQPVRGKQDAMTVTALGPLPVGCDYHPWMNAYIFGVDNPYYAVTGPDGSFSIDGIPPGTYTVRMWLNGMKIIPRKDNQGRIIRYGYSDPSTREKQIEVKGGAAAEVSFEIVPQ